MTQEELILENDELRARLSLAEKWMKREVQAAIRHIQKKEVQNSTRKHFENLFEEEGIDMIAQRIMDIFWESLTFAPKFTLERLIDAEIYWSTLQQYPTVDALPIIIAYQKILDAWIEESLITHWRWMYKWQSYYNSSLDNQLEKDLYNVLTKDYSLSIGRFYQMIEMIHKNETGGKLILDLAVYWKESIPHIFWLLLSQSFFDWLATLMNREIFTKKRHETKVTYSDAKKIREVLLDDSLLKNIFLASSIWK